MRVTLKKITVTTIISFVLYVFIMLSLFSCRTAKKEWVKENFTSKEQLVSIQEDLTYSNEEVKNDIKTSVLSDLREVINAFSQKINSNETENSTVKGTITAEDGKEKSATIGNTTIKSNGANITFETSSTKTLNKEIETKFKEVTKQLKEERAFNQTLVSKLNTLELKQLEQQKQIEQLKESKSKTTTKKGFTFGTIIIVAIVLVLLVLLVLLWYFRSKIKLFLGKYV